MIEEFFYYTKSSPFPSLKEGILNPINEN